MNPIKSFLILFVLFSLKGYNQNCTSCTNTINGASSQNITVNNGDVLCISSTGNLSGNIIQNGGVVCNEGIISGYITISGGTFNNYGNISGSSQYINHDKGVFVNYGEIDNLSFSAVGSGITVNNHGMLKTGYIDLDSMSNGTRPIFNNYGTIISGNFTTERSDFSNHDSVTLSGNFIVGVLGYFLNDGFLTIGGNCNFSAADAYIQTNCVAQVSGNFTNNGTVNGPHNSCGGFYVNGFASNSSTGKIGMDNSFIDICEQGNSTGLSNAGALGQNMTQCSCSNVCNSTTGINKKTPLHTLNIYPNPVTTKLFFEQTSNFEPTNYFIYNSMGKLVQTGIILSEYISTNDLKPGAYYIALSDSKNLYRLKFIKI